MRKQKNTMLELVRERIERRPRKAEGMGPILSEQVGNTVALAQVAKWLKRPIEKRNRIKGERGGNKRRKLAEPQKGGRPCRCVYTNTRQSRRHPEEDAIAKGRDHIE